MAPFSPHKTRLMVKKLEGHTFISYSSVAQRGVKERVIKEYLGFQRAQKASKLL